MDSESVAGGQGTTHKWATEHEKAKILLWHSPVDLYSEVSPAMFSVI